MPKYVYKSYKELLLSDIKMIGIQEPEKVRIKKYLCKECNIKYQGKENYINHKKQQHNNKHICIYCNKYFSTKRGMVHHIKIRRCKYTFVIG